MKEGIEKFEAINEQNKKIIKKMDERKKTSVSEEGRMRERD